MIETMTVEFNIPIRSSGSTTLKSELKQRGLEPDECYYVAHEGAVRGRESIDLGVDPPPDAATPKGCAARAVGCRGGLPRASTHAAGSSRAPRTAS
jgi:hypothetical protein